VYPLTSTSTQQELDVANLMLESGFNAVLQLPTSAGKTWRAASAMRAAARRGYKSIYVTPTRALANELFAKWTEDWSDVAVGIFTGDYGRDRDLPLTYSAADVLIMTPERLDLCTRQWRVHWHWLPKVDVLAIDEVHLLADASRGARLEGAIVRFRHLNPFARLMALSATLGNPEVLAKWLDGVFYQSTVRPTPLTWREVTYSRATDKPGLLCDELRALRNGGGQAIVFVQSKRRAEELAEILRACGISAKHHHGGLAFDARTSAEIDFRAGVVMALVATATLEVGLNLPARQVVLYDLQQFNGTEFEPLSVISAWQRAGRAGRPGHDSAGEVVTFRARWERAVPYDQGNFEPIASQLRSPEALCEEIIAIIGSGYARDIDELRAHLSRTLAESAGVKLRFEAQVHAMCEAGFLLAEEQESRPLPKLRATALGRLCNRLQVSPFSLVKAKAALTTNSSWTYFDLLLLCCALPDSSPVLTVDFEEVDELELQLAGVASYLFQDKDPFTQALDQLTPKRALSATKAALVLHEWTESGDVEQVANKCCTYPGEVTQLRDSTIRLLSALSGLVTQLRGEGAEVSANLDQVTKQIERLSLMVSMGLNDDNATLTQVAGIGASWAKKLNAGGVTDLDCLAQSDAETLVGLGRISQGRAEAWIRAASDLVKSEEHFAAVASTRKARVDRRVIEAHVDIYRLKRSWQLRVTTGGRKTELHVTGGADPHHLWLARSGWQCDCLDQQRGNECKHLIAVRRWQRDPAILALDENLLHCHPAVGVSLKQWWSQ